MTVSREQAHFGVKIAVYLAKFPDDVPAVKAICVSASSLGAKTARDAAEITAGRSLNDSEWSKFGPRWERVWAALISN